MDAVDQGQQKEIEFLKKMYVVLMLTIVLVFVVGMIMFSSKEISCPHRECPHHILQTNHE